MNGPGNRERIDLDLLEACRNASVRHLVYASSSSVYGGNTVYGPWGRPDMSPILFARAIFEGRPIDVYNHGRMQRDFTHIDDIVEGVVRVLRNSVEGFKTKPVRDESESRYFA